MPDQWEESIPLGSGQEPFPDKYPDWFVYGTVDAFIKAMHEDAEEYGSVG
jgi:hypothetical protein